MRSNGSQSCQKTKVLQSFSKETRKRTGDNYTERKCSQKTLLIVVKELFKIQ